MRRLDRLFVSSTYTRSFRSLTAEIRSILGMHPQEIRHRCEEVTSRLDAALDALNELVDVLERS